MRTVDVGYINLVHDAWLGDDAQPHRTEDDRWLFTQTISQEYLKNQPAPRAHAVVSILAGRGIQALVVGIISFIKMQALPEDAAYGNAAGRYGYDMMDAASAEAVRNELGLD